MEISVGESHEEAARQAAALGASAIREALLERKRAVIVLTTGTSQIPLLTHLAAEPDIEWDAVVLFPLDEYVGLPSRHPASTRRYLEERFIDVLPTGLRAFHPIVGDSDDPVTEAVRMGRLLREERVDVTFLGIGENGHIAFNDPPADFESLDPYLVVDLEERCRRQQVREGWFASVAEVPEEAISMSVQQILASRRLICLVPEERKAKAVQAAVEGKVSNQLPASILREHGAFHLFLDRGSAQLLSQASLKE